MMNDNETVAGCVRRIRKNILSAGCEGRVHCDYGDLMKAFDAIEAAHKREIAAKDDEIARLNEQIVVHDCWADEECEDADTARMCAENELRDLAKELADEVTARDAEIASLRALVGEMADALEKLESIGVDCSCCGIPCDRLDRHEGCIVDGIGALVAKAREVVK